MKNLLKIDDGVKLVTEFDASKVRDRGKFVVGDSSKTKSKFFNKTIFNEPLQAATYYYITIVLMNEFMSKRKYAVYHIATHTHGIDVESSAANAGLYALLLLLVIPGVVAWVVLK